jgi:peptidoglycan hydrolase-like protein with peptidoglycan-binding domain
MKKFVYFVLVIIAAVALVSCGRREQSLEELQEPIAMDTLTSMNATTNIAVSASPETKTAVAPVTAAPIEKATTVAVSGYVKPAGEEIQTALKNAGFYTGAIDGKIGPMTKKAIEEFQKANNLQADGKVGPKTWVVLSTHLNPQAEKKR